MEYSVREIETTAGKRWEVVDGGGNSTGAGLFGSMSEAWRWIDRHDDGAVSSSEARHQYGWDRYVNGD